MEILLKILVAPFALALSLLAIASMILAVLGVALFFTPTPIGGIVFLFLALLPPRLNNWKNLHLCGQKVLLSHRMKKHRL